MLLKHELCRKQNECNVCFLLLRLLPLDVVLFKTLIKGLQAKMRFREVLSLALFIIFAFTPDILLPRSCSKYIDAHKEFERSVGAISVRYRSELKLLDVLVPNESAKTRAMIVSDLHFRSLRTKLAMLQRVEEATKQLEVGAVLLQLCFYERDKIS